MSTPGQGNVGAGHSTADDNSGNCHLYQSLDKNTAVTAAPDYQNVQTLFAASDYQNVQTLFAASDYQNVQTLEGDVPCASVHILGSQTESAYEPLKGSETQNFYEPLIERSNWIATGLEVKKEKLYLVKCWFESVALDFW